MSLTTLAYGLLISFLGPLVAGLVALLPSKQAHRASQVVLGVSALIGTVVGIMIATGDAGLSLLLPTSLSAAGAEASTASWPFFFGMVFGLDRFSAIFYTIISAVTALVALYAVPYLEAYAGTYNLRGVNALTGFFVFGMLGVVLSTNIIGFMTFWEIMSMSSFFLVVADGSDESRHAGFLYLVMTHLGAGAIMGGLFLLSGGALLSDFSVLAIITPQLPASTLNVALALLLFGFGSKAGLVPFHVWLPEAHPQAPSHVSALMSGVMLKVALYGFLRVLLFLVPTIPVWFVLTVIILGLMSAVVGVLYAVLERDMKRMLAYSSIENLGLIFTMVGVGMLAGQQGSVELTQAALYAALFLAVAHAFFKSGLFMAAGAVIAAVHTRNFEAMGGLARRMPQFSVAVCVLIFTAAAMPPFGPFIAEWTFLQSIVGALLGAVAMLKVVLVVVLAILGFVAGLALFAMVKFYGIAFLAQPRSEEAEAATEPVAGMLAPVAATALIGLLLGVFTPVLLGRLGALDLVQNTQEARVITTGGGALVPLEVFLMMLGILVFLFLVRRLVTNVQFERTYQTWNCGQPITPRMEYTATAFSAPIRFFFRFFLRAQKVVEVTPLLATNPWVASRTMRLEVRQAWYDYLYVPALWGLNTIAKLAGRLQNGNIQFYLSLILVALFVTMIVAL